MACQVPVDKCAELVKAGIGFFPDPLTGYGVTRQAHDAVQHSMIDDFLNAARGAALPLLLPTRRDKLFENRVQSWL